MTTIYEVGGDVDLMQVTFQDRKFGLAFLDIWGKRPDPAWTAPEMTVLVDKHDLEPQWVPTDCPNFNSRHLMLSARAVRALSPLIAAHGEFLPVRVPGGDYAIFNCFTELDALDEAATEGRRAPSGFLTHIRRYALRAEALADLPPIFRLRRRLAPLFVTDRFLDAARRAGLTGFVFTPIWSSGQGGIAIPEAPIWEADPKGAARAARERRLAILRGAGAVS